MKIAYVSGSSNNFVWDYLNSFYLRGHDVVLYSLDGNQNAEKNIYNLPIVDISYGARGYRQLSKWKYIFSGLKLRKLLLLNKPDILHGHYITSAGLVCYISKFHPVILSGRGSDVLVSLRSKWKRKVYRRMLQSTEMLHSVSPQITNDLLEIISSKTPVLTLTQGINLELFKNQIIEDQRFLEKTTSYKIICTRWLKNIYDPFTIIKAIHFMVTHNYDVSITFAADGTLYNDLLKYSEENNIENHVKFLRGYKYEEIPCLLNKHDIYISSSLSDGTSLSLIEAMASGLFPIVSRIESNSEWIQDSDNGLLFECGNHIDLAKKIILFLNDPKIGLRAKVRNQELVHKFADRDLNMQKLEKQYRMIIDNKKKF